MDDVTEKMYIIVDRKGRGDITSLKHRRKDCISFFMEDASMSWSNAKKYGWRCIPVEVKASIPGAKEVPKWIDINVSQPDPGSKVLVITDYTPWGRTKYVQIANVYWSDFPVECGGANSLTGHGILIGLYFAIPAILKPGVVTHWMELPETI